MNRRYPSADDLWQSINQEDDSTVRRNLLIEMSRLLLEMDNIGWTQADQKIEPDSTSILLEYQVIAELVSSRMQQALPWIDVDFKGEPLEQELQEVQKNLITYAEETTETLQQLKLLKEQQVNLEKQQEGLQTQQQDLQTTTEVIDQLEQAIAKLTELLDKHDDTEQEVVVERILADFNPILISSLEHYQRLVLAWQQHQKENDIVAEGLALRAESADTQAMKRVPELARNISQKLEEYDQLLVKLL